jgi:hypothetical protein
MLITSELLFDKNSMTTIDDIEETERNLRATDYYNCINRTEFTWVLINTMQIL